MAVITCDNCNKEIGKLEPRVSTMTEVGLIVICKKCADEST